MSRKSAAQIDGVNNKSGTGNPGGTRALLSLNSSIRIPFKNLHCIEIPTLL